MKTIKDLLEVMKEHAKADRLSQGVFCGFFYACAMQTKENPIEKACALYGLPLWIGYWSEKVFGWLPHEEAIQWPILLLQALVDNPCDLEDLRHDLAIKRLTLLSENSEGDVKSAIDGVIHYHQTRDESLRESAGAAVKSAAGSAEPVWSAVWSTAEPARSAAWSAAGSAARSAVRSAESAKSVAWSAVGKNERDWILELLMNDDSDGTFIDEGTK